MHLLAERISSLFSTLSYQSIKEHIITIAHLLRSPTNLMNFPTLSIALSLVFGWTHDVIFNSFHHETWCMAATTICLVPAVYCTSNCSYYHLKCCVPLLRFCRTCLQSICDLTILPVYRPLLDGQSWRWACHVTASLQQHWKPHAKMFDKYYRYGTILSAKIWNTITVFHCLSFPA